MIEKFEKRDSIVSINHRLGRISLHTAATKLSTIRVRRKDDGFLEVYSRVYGGAWTEGDQGMHDKMREVISTHLLKISANGYYYIDKDNFEVVNRRFNTVKQTTL